MILQAERASPRIGANPEYTAALNDINTAITSTLNLEAILNLLLEKIDLVLPNAITTIRLFNKETGELEPAACRNIDEALWRAVTPQFPQRLTKLVLDRKTPLSIANIQTDTRSDNHAFARRFGLVSYLGIPLLAKDDLLGLIAFYTKEGHSFGSQELQFLTTLSAQLAIAIHHAKLYEETKRSASQIAALHAITLAATQSLDLDLILNEIIKKITEIFGFDTTHIYLFNTAKDELHMKAGFELNPALWTHRKLFARGQGILGKVAETGDCFISEDIQCDARYSEMSHSKISQKAGISFFAVFPIKAKLRNWGAMVCVGENPRKLKSDEVKILTSMTNQIGIAVENAMLYEQTALRAKELSALYSVVAIASESLELKVLLRKTMHKILEIFRFDAARVYLRQNDPRELCLVVCQGIPDDVTPKSEYRIGEGLVGRVGQTGEPLVFGDMQTDLRYDELAGFRVMLKAGFRGSFFIPIKIRGETIGVLNLLSREPYEFSESDVQLINSIAYHLGIAAGNASLFSQLKSKTIELERGNKAKSEFLGVMSHELRTPLNVIKGYTELIRRQVLGSITSGQEAALDKIAAQSADLLNMISDVLQVTVIEADTVKIESSEVNLNQFLGRLKSNYDLPFDKKLEIKWDYPSDLPILRMDEDKLKAVLQNLINNAIKFTEAGSISISVQHNRDVGTIEFSIKDTGIGIPQDKLESIFNAFQQADGSTTRRFGGVGLGLYIVKKFTELLRGKVEVKSEFGKGSTFTVSLPAIAVELSGGMIS